LSYDEFISELGKAGLSVRKFAELVGMRPNSVSNNARRGEVPAHLAVIAALLSELAVHRIPIDPVFSRIEVSKNIKKPRGASATGKFGGDKQGRLEFLP
jgi:hypothetical protein